MAQNVANDHFKVSAEENELYLFDQLIYLPLSYPGAYRPDRLLDESEGASPCGG